MIFSIALLAVSLSIDAFGVGIAYGLRKISIPLLSKLVICLFSIIYSGIALVLGKAMNHLLPPVVSRGIGIVILMAMGIWILLQALFKSEKAGMKEVESSCGSRTLLEVAIKSLGITIQVIKNPAAGDIDKSGIIDTRESFLLGFALSVDAIGVGIGSALAGFTSITIPFTIGLFQLLFLYMGTYLGKRVAAAGKLNKKTLSLIPGILLISLAIIRIC